MTYRYIKFQSNKFIMIIIMLINNKNTLNREEESVPRSFWLTR